MCQARANTSKGPRHKANLLWLLILLLFGEGLAVAAVAAEPSPSQTQASTVPRNAVAYKLEEMSTFDAPETARRRLLVGAYTECQTEPDEEVRAYPAFKSDRPVYGSLQVGSTGAGSQTGFRYAVAVDESAGTGQGYDRMYIDTNRNGDLTDDQYRVPMKNVPSKALMGVGASATEVCFEPMTLHVAPGDGREHRVEVMPRLLAYEGSRSFVMLTAMQARKGMIAIAGKGFTAVLGHSGVLTSRFDQPDTGLYLFPASDSRSRPMASWYGGDRLKALHRLGDTYYRLAATPNGDRIFVWPYQGAFGTLEVKSGRRSATTVQASGSLAARDVAVSLNEGLDAQNVKPTDSYRLPVGDYAVEMLSINYDALNCLVLRNSHEDGRPGGRASQGPSAYAIRIREDKPFALDLSGRPQVLFAAPGKDQRFAPSEQLEVKAVLTDPQLDIMFRMVNQGGPLNPKVTIRRANGQIVAEGTMPFG